MKMFRSAVSIALAIVVAQPVLAHGTTKPRHGGIVVMSGETLFELVNAPGGVQLYVLDDEDPVNAAGMTARLTTDVAGKPQNIMLRPVAGNRFDGPRLTLRPGAKVAVLVVDKASQAHMGATFVIK